MEKNTRHPIGIMADSLRLPFAESLQKCRQLGADGVQCVGSKFVLYRKSEKKEQAKPKKAKVNPVRKGVQTRRRKMEAERQKRDAYFKKQAIEAAIERSREKARRERD